MGFFEQLLRGFFAAAFHGTDDAGDDGKFYRSMLDDLALDQRHGSLQGPNDAFPLMGCAFTFVHAC